MLNLGLALKIDKKKKTTYKVILKKKNCTSKSFFPSVLIDFPCSQWNTCSALSRPCTTTFVQRARIPLNRICIMPDCTSFIYFHIRTGWPVWPRSRIYGLHLDGTIWIYFWCYWALDSAICWRVSRTTCNMQCNRWESNADHFTHVARSTFHSCHTVHTQFTIHTLVAFSQCPRHFGHSHVHVIVQLWNWFMKWTTPFRTCPNFLWQQFVLHLPAAGQEHQVSHKFRFKRLTRIPNMLTRGVQHLEGIICHSY